MPKYDVMVTVVVDAPDHVTALNAVENAVQGCNNLDAELDNSHVECHECLYQFSSEERRDEQCECNG